MVTDDPGARPIWRLTSPACRVICRAGTNEIKSVAVWSPGHGYRAVRPDGEQLDVLRDFTKQVAGEIAASAWPPGTGAGRAGVGAAVVGGTDLPAEGAELLSLVQELTDPRLLICRVVGVMAQVAAAHLGFVPVAAEAIGRLAAGLASRLTEPEPESPGTRALQYADVTFSAAGELTEYLDVGRVEVRSLVDESSRLRDLDRDRPTPRSRTANPPASRSRTMNPPASRRRTTNRIGLVQALPERQVRRAARMPGVSPVRGSQPGVRPVIRGLPPGVRPVVRGLPPGQGQIAERPVPGAGGPGRYRPPPRYRPGRRGVRSRGGVLGRDELNDRGEPPSREGPSAR